jgi:hypothetical protein
MIDRNGENVVFVLGAPRSGTTWLAKIFDSHPDVIYRHEPDTVLRSDCIPVIYSDTQTAIRTEEVREYLFRLFALRSLKSAGSLPMFRKRFRPAPTEYLRTLAVYGAKVAASAGLSSLANIAIPDLVSRNGPDPIRYVLKSVSARGRVKLFSEALPKSKTVFLVRHPCGQVASTLTGITKGKFEKSIPFAEVLSTNEARQIGLTADVFGKLDLVQKCAWHWAILNQKALNDLPGAGRAVTVQYEALCNAPKMVVGQLFTFAGLDWNTQSEEFLRKSTTTDGSKGYFQVVRNSLAAAQSWRTTLDKDMQRKVLEIATRVAAGRMFEA